MNDEAFFAWLEEGIQNGFCCDVFCLDHDVPPMTEEEAEWKNEFDEVCLPLVRLWEPGVSQGTGTVSEPADTTNPVDDLP